MKRRAFLGLMAAVPAALILPELLMPNRTFFLPPTGGWAQESLAQLWLDYANQVRPAGVLLRMVPAMVRIPAVYESVGMHGCVDLIVPEETDAELRARMLSALKQTPKYSWPVPTLADFMPWENA